MGKVIFAIIFLVMMATIAVTTYQLGNSIGITPEMIQQASDSGLLPISIKALVITGLILAAIISAFVALIATLMIKFWVKMAKAVWFTITLAYRSVRMMTVGAVKVTRLVHRIVDEANTDGTEHYRRRPPFYTRVWNTPTVMGSRQPIVKARQDVTAAYAVIKNKTLEDILDELRSLANLLAIEVKRLTVQLRQAALRKIVFGLGRHRVARFFIRRYTTLVKAVAAISATVLASAHYAKRETEEFVAEGTDPVEGIPPYIRERVWHFIKVFTSDIYLHGKNTLSPALGRMRRK